jgi:hypothetical protein
MSQPGTDRAARWIAATIAGITLGAALGGCSDLYFDRRETIALSGGDAIAANEAEQMVDPWPPHSGNRNIPYNGEKMQSAVERYRTNHVIPPLNTTTSSVENAQTAQAAASAMSGTQNASASAPPVAATSVQ